MPQENATALARLEAMQEGNAVLNDCLAAMLAPDSMVQFRALRMVVGYIIKYLRADDGYLLRVDPVSNLALEVFTTYGQETAPLVAPLCGAVEVPKAAEIFAHCRFVTTPLPFLDNSPARGSRWEQVFTAHGYRTVASIGLTLGGAFWGMATMLFKAPDRVFSAEEKLTIETFGRIMDMNLYRMSLFRQLEQERDAADTALRDLAQANQMWQLMLQYFPGHFCLKDYDNGNRYVMVNREFSEFVGKPTRDILGRALADIIPDAREAESIERCDREIVAANQPQTVTRCLTSASGRAFSLNSLRIPYVGMDGHHYLLVMADNAADLRAERELNERLGSEQVRLLKEAWLLINDTPIPLAMFGGDGALLRCNQAFLDCMEMTQREFAALPLAERALHYPGHSEDGSPVDAVIGHGQREAAAVWSLGGRDWEFHAHGCFDAAGRLAYVFEYATDVTELRERLRRQTDLAATREATDRSKSQFIDNISHGIRTPLNAVLGYAAMALKNLPPDNRAAAYLRKIDISGRHLLELVNALLDIRRLGLEPTAACLCPVNLRGKVDELLMPAQELAAARRVALSGVAEMDDADVYADPLRLDEAVQTLLTDAIRRTPAGGKVELAIRQYPCSAMGYGQYRLSVSDCGPGLPPASREQLQEFFNRRAEDDHAERMEPGLGLAVVKRLVDAMGGVVTVGENPGGGTLFTLEFTLRLQPPAPAAEEAAPPPPPAARSRERVLLVDDNATNRQLAREVLEGAGLVVEEAGDGALAVRMIAEAAPGHYGAVLMDLEMPVMNGYHATRAIRALPDPARAGIPIIAMTANAAPTARREAIDWGLDSYLPMPVNMTELVATVKRFLER